MGYTRLMKTLLLALLLFIFPVLAWSHPGKTDSVGGHKCYKGCEKWELLFGEYHLHDKDGKPIRVAKKARKKQQSDVEPAVTLVRDDRVGTPQPVPAGMASSTEPVQPEESLLTSPFLLVLLALLLLLLLIRRRTGQKQ